MPSLVVMEGDIFIALCITKVWMMDLVFFVLAISVLVVSLNKGIRSLFKK